VANTVTITVDADTKKAESNVKGMGGKMRTALKGVAMASGAITLAAAGAAKLGQEYQEATNTIAAGTGATGEDLEALTQSFKDVWATVPQDAATVSSAVADINTEFGFTGEKLESVTEAMLTASRAMGEDLGGVIKSTADLLVAFGEDKGGAELLLDKLTVAAQFSGSSMQGLADKVINFAPQLEALGLPMDSAIALIANMDAAGMSASKMMPGLNTAIKKLSSEGVTDIAGGLQNAIDKIQNAETDADGLGVAMDLFGAGAGLRFQAAIKEGVFELDGLLAAMDDSDGTLAALGETTLTMSDKFDIMKNRVKGTLAPIGNFATALGPMVIMIPALTTGFSALAASQTIATAATWLQTAAMAALNFAMGPIGLIILGIVAAVAAAILIFKNWDKIVETVKKTWDTVWNGIKSLFDTVMGKLESVFNSKLGWLLPGGALIKGLNLLKDNWDTIWNGMKATLKAVVTPITGFINGVIGAFNALFNVMRPIELGWDAKKVLGKTILPAFSIAPFGVLPTIPEIPSFAKGGIVTKPTIAQIGEAGPEAIVPLRAGAGMGTTVIINFPQGSTVILDNEASARSLADQITQQIRGVLRAQGTF